MTNLTPEALYLQLGQLLAEMPNFDEYPLSKETHLWLGRAFALLEQTQVTADASSFKEAVEKVVGPYTRKKVEGTGTMTAILYRALGRVELRVPAGLQGKFIPVGSPYDAFVAVGQVLSGATSDLFIVDPYADEKLLDHYALQTPEKVALRVLADQKSHKVSLKPAASTWISQFGTLRPLEVRLATAGWLHDRLIIVDKTVAFDLGQSFNCLAERSPTSLTWANPETAKEKIAHYETLWQSSGPL